LKFRINAGIAAVGGSAEGKLGDKGTWLVAARQSYLQYLLDRLTTEPGLAFEYRDVQAKAAYALTPHHHFSLLLMDGVSSLNRNSVASTLGLNSLDTSSFNSTTAIATWRYTPNATWIVTNRVAYLRERYGEKNKTPSPLEQGFYGEWAWYGGAAKQWGGFGSTDFGGTFRRIREDGYADKLFTPPTPASLLDQFRGSGTLGGFYGRQSWKFKKRLRLEAGARSDWHSGPQPQVVSPYASLTADAWKGGSITASWAQAAQFAEVSQLTSILGRPNLLPERSSQAQLTVQQMFGESTRLRVDVYDRLDRDLIFQPLYDPRFLNAVVFSGNLLAPLQNSQRGYGKGAEIFLQRRSANRLSGWVSYAYAVSRVHDGVLNLSEAIRVRFKELSACLRQLSLDVDDQSKRPVRVRLGSAGAWILRAEKRRHVSFDQFQPTTFAGVSADGFSDQQGFREEEDSIDAVRGGDEYHQLLEHDFR
jgi:outer membrane cobalamin receptor